VREADVQRILNKIFRSRQIRDVPGHPGYVMLHEVKGRRLFDRHVIKVRDKIESYATGKKEPLVVSVFDRERVSIEHSTSGGWQSSRLDEKLIMVPKKVRVARLSRAIEAMGKRVTPKRISTLLGTHVARRKWIPGREVQIALVARFGEPFKKDWLRERLGDVLRHELAHAMDETARQDQMARWADRDGDEFERDTAGVVLGLGLPRRLLNVWHDVKRPERKRKKKVLRTSREPRKPRVFDAAYYNEPKEVTARIVEILYELDREDALKIELELFGTKYGRSNQLLAATRWASPTFARLEMWLTPKSFARVMKAIYDRYHAEPWFPQATGVYKNRRRTSRRRTSRP
jgi:hypothetical protein